MKSPKVYFPSNMWCVAFASFQSRSASDSRKCLRRNSVNHWKPFSRPSVRHFPTLWTNDKWLIFSWANVSMLMCLWRLWSVEISVTVAVLKIRNSLTKEKSLRTKNLSYLCLKRHLVQYLTYLVTKLFKWTVFQLCIMFYMIKLSLFVLYVF